MTTVIPDKDLLKLLQHRLIIAEMPFLINGKTCYMMPSLLPALKEGDILRPQFTAASLLLVTFPEVWVPICLCCVAVVSLLSHKACQDFVQQYFKALQESIGIFHLLSPWHTLVNTVRQLELHPTSILPCNHVLDSLIRQAIDQSLEEVCSKYPYKPPHQFAFTCNGGTSLHAKLISNDKSTVQCMKDPEEVEPLSDKQKLWVLPQDYYSE